MKKWELMKTHNDTWRYNGLRGEQKMSSRGREGQGQELRYTVLKRAHSLSAHSTVITVDVLLNGDQFDQHCLFAV